MLAMLEEMNDEALEELVAYGETADAADDEAGGGAFAAARSLAADVAAAQAGPAAPPRKRLSRTELTLRAVEAQLASNDANAAQRLHAAQVKLTEAITAGRNAVFGGKPLSERIKAADDSGTAREFEGIVRAGFDDFAHDARQVVSDIFEAECSTFRRAAKAQQQWMQLKMQASRTAAGVQMEQQRVRIEAAHAEVLERYKHDALGIASQELVEMRGRAAKAEHALAHLSQVRAWHARTCTPCTYARAHPADPCMYTRSTPSRPCRRRGTPPWPSSRRPSPIWASRSTGTGRSRSR